MDRTRSVGLGPTGVKPLRPLGGSIGGGGADVYQNREAWQSALSQSKVRLQWDPDHNPRGDRLDRKAIQLGIRGEVLHQLNQAWITEIVDVTDFVKEQHRFAKGDFEELSVPFERVQIYKDQGIINNIGLTSSLNFSRWQNEAND